MASTNDLGVVSTPGQSGKVIPPGHDETPTFNAHTCRSELQADIARSNYSNAALPRPLNRTAPNGNAARIDQNILAEQLRQLGAAADVAERETLQRELDAASSHRGAVGSVVSERDVQTGESVTLPRTFEELAARHARAYARGELSTAERDRDLEQACRELTPEERDHLMLKVYQRAFQEYHATIREEMPWYERAYAAAKGYLTDVGDFVNAAVSSVKRFGCGIVRTVETIGENGAKIVGLGREALAVVTWDHVVSGAKFVGGALVDLTVSAVKGLAEASGIPSLVRAGGAVLSGDFRSAWTELGNAVAAPVNAVIGVGKIVLDTAESLGIGQIFRGVGCLLCGDLNGALQAGRGAWTLLTEATGLADAYRAISFGGQALYAGLITGDFKAAAILGAQAVMYLGFAALSAGSIAATVATLGAAGTSVLGVLGLRRSVQVAAEEMVETGLKTTIREGLEQVGQKIGRELLEAGIEKEAVGLGRAAGEATMREIAARVIGHDITREVAEKVATEVAQKNTRAAVETCVKKTLAETTERLLSKGAIDSTLSALVKDGLIELGVTAEMKHLILKGGRELAERGLHEALEKGVREVIETPLYNAMKRGFTESVEKGLLNFVRQGVRVEIREGIEAGVKRGFEQGFREGLERAIREGIVHGLKAVREGKVRFRPRLEGGAKPACAHGSRAGEDGPEAGEGVSTDVERPHAGEPHSQPGQRILAMVSYGPHGERITRTYLDRGDDSTRLELIKESREEAA